MTLDITIHPPGKPAAGPRDLGEAGEGHTILIEGESPDGGSAQWAVAVGAAAIRGASVVRRT